MCKYIERDDLTFEVSSLGKRVETQKHGSVMDCVMSIRHLFVNLLITPFLGLAEVKSPTF